MDESILGIEGRQSDQFQWHIHSEKLEAMSEGERDAYLNEKTSRLYDALTAFVKSEGKASLEEIDAILNPEVHIESEERGQL